MLSLVTDQASDPALWSSRLAPPVEARQAGSLPEDGFSVITVGGYNPEESRIVATVPTVPQTPVGIAHCLYDLVVTRDTEWRPTT